jgi:type III pantothenate kinase
MILLDCGNSKIKAQHYDAGRLRASFACSYQVDWKAQLMRWIRPLRSKQVFLCSVLDSARQARLESSLSEHLELTRFVSETQALGVVNGYGEPGRLGSDRWMALLGAAAMSSGDCMIIDAGSAITIDLLRADGHHLGGAILPGFNTSIDVFKRIFSHIDFNDPAIAVSDKPGCSTEAAIQIDYELNSLDRLPILVNRWMSLLDDRAALLLAGGDAVRAQDLLDRPARIVPDLVFRGMLRLINR